MSILIPLWMRSDIPLEHLKINEENIKTMGKLIYDSSFYNTREALNKDFSENVSSIQRHISHAPRATITIEIDSRFFYVSKSRVTNNGKALTDSEVQNISDFIGLEA